MKRSSGLVVALLLLFVVGCAGRGQGPTSSGRDGGDPEVVALPCAERVEEGSKIPDSYTVVAGVVALPTTGELGVSPLEDDGGRFALWAKSGLLVRSDSEFTISVSDPYRGAIGWGTPPRFAATVRSDGCAGEDWIAFPGGYLTDRPRCMELVVTSGGRSETVSVGLGTPCPTE